MEAKNKEQPTPFFSEDKSPPKPAMEPWVVLMVDDEPDVHTVTELALSDLVYDGREIELGSAYSAEEAKVFLKEHPETALILLDVVMETEHAGLELVRHIREEMKNSLVRIILRTGQPGQAPERRVILDYDINDYREKADLSSQKLFTSVVTALRGYGDLITIERNRHGLDKIIRSAGSLYSIQSLEEFIGGVLCQLQALLNIGGKLFFSHSFGFLKEAGDVDIGSQRIITAAGPSSESTHKTVKEVANGETMARIERALKEQRSLYFDDACLIELHSSEGREGLVYIDGCHYLPDETDRHLIEVFGSNATIALGNLLLHRELEFTQREVLFTLGEFAECRSMETGRHVARVSKLSGLFATKLEYPADENDMLQLAAIMHDIGKLGVPTKLLEKQGKLDPDEWVQMQEHSRIGYDLLRRAKRPLLKNAAIIAHTHHERWDGSGYPNGLKGEEIHIYGRIVAIVDVFDALGNHRSYKKPWPLEEVREYFGQQRGKLFDPRLTDILLDNFADFCELREEYRDF